MNFEVLTNKQSKQFWAKVVHVGDDTEAKRSSDAHWYWTGTINRSTPVIYTALQGDLTANNKSVRKVLWEIVYGNAPKRVDAACGDKACINPKHYKVPDMPEVDWQAVDRYCLTWIELTKAPKETTEETDKVPEVSLENLLDIDNDVYYDEGNEDELYDAP